MANLIVTEYAGIASVEGDRYGIPVPRQHNATQVVEITGVSLKSRPVEDGTNLVRVYAEGDCMIKIGVDPEAAPGDGFALGKGQFDFANIEPGQRVAVIFRMEA